MRLIKTVPSERRYYNRAPIYGTKNNKLTLLSGRSCCSRLEVKELMLGPVKQSTERAQVKLLEGIGLPGVARKESMATATAPILTKKSAIPRSEYQRRPSSAKRAQVPRKAVLTTIALRRSNVYESGSFNEKGEKEKSKEREEGERKIRKIIKERIMVRNL